MFDVHVPVVPPSGVGSVNEFYLSLLPELPKPIHPSSPTSHHSNHQHGNLERLGLRVDISH